MRAHFRSSTIAAIAIAGVVALVSAPSPPPSAPHPPTVARDVELTAAPALGAIPLAFIRNQFQYCALICPYGVQAAIAVPVGTVAAPVTFLGSLVSTGSPLKAIGAALASITGPANAAATPLFNNDVYLVVPKAFHALDVALVEAISVGASLLTPGEFLAAVQNGRTSILAALDQPVGTPTTPTGARNIVAVVTVEAVNVTTAVLFQAGELLLLGVIQTADAAAQELARSGDPAAALAAGATQASKVIHEASGVVASAVNTAITNISNSLRDPFPSTLPTAPPASPAPVTRHVDPPGSSAPALTLESASDKKDSDGGLSAPGMVEPSDENGGDGKGSTDADDATRKVDTKKADTKKADTEKVDTKKAGTEKADEQEADDHRDVRGPASLDQPASSSVSSAGRSSPDETTDSAIPSARKNAMNSGPPR